MVHRVVAVSLALSRRLSFPFPFPSPLVSPPPRPSRWRARRQGLCVGVEAVTWPLAPVPPCEQSSQRWGSGAGASSPSRRPHNPPHEQMLMAVAWCRPLCVPHPPLPRRPSTHHPPVSSCSRGWRWVVRRPGSSPLVPLVHLVCP